MNVRRFFPLFFLMFLLLAVSLACATLAGPAPTTAPIQQSQPSPSNPTPVPPKPTAEPVDPPTPVNETGGLTTFTDKNKLYAIQVPSDWAHSQNSGDNYYIDTFKSPDEMALVENIAYDDGTTFNGGEKGRFALQLIYRFYSKTGTSSDIKITSDQIMKDGSERLEWESKSGGYSGASYFETRTGRTTFLMFTIEWMNSAETQYIDTLNNVVASYMIP